MTFDLSIRFKEFELKAGLIDLKTFLNPKSFKILLIFLSKKMVTHPL